jgi:hypothetical protein
VDPSLLAATLLAVVVAGISSWVLSDARRRVHRGRHVVVVFLGYTINRPETWAVLCLFLSVLFVPIFLVARRTDE